jgi:hypothetical protein
MAQQYRLRLAEGTLLVVDHDALTTWLVDEKALVQPVGAKRWRLLKQFLADERTGDISPSYWEELPPEQRRRRRAPKEEKHTSIRDVVTGWFKPRAHAPERQSSHATSDDMSPLLRALRKAEVPLDVPSTPPPLSTDILADAPPLAAPESEPFQLPEEKEDGDVVAVSEEAMAAPVADSSGDWTPQTEEAPFYVGESPAPQTNAGAEPVAVEPEPEPEPHVDPHVEAEPEPEPEPEIEITLNKLLPPLPVDAPPAPMPAILARAPDPPPAPVAAAPPVPDVEVTVNKPLPPGLKPRKVRADAPARPAPPAAPPAPPLPPEPEQDLEVTVNKARPPELKAPRKPRADAPPRPAPPPVPPLAPPKPVAPPPPKPSVTTPPPPVLSPELERDLEVTINKQLPPEWMAPPRPRAEAPPRPVLPPEPTPNVEVTVNKQRVPPPEPPPPPVLTPELERDLEVTINKQLPPELMAPARPRAEAPVRPAPPPEPVPMPIAPEPEPPVTHALSEDAERLRDAMSAFLSAQKEEARQAPQWPAAPRHEPISTPRAGTSPPLQTLADDTGPSIRLKPLATEEPASEVFHDEPVEKVVWGSGPMGNFLAMIAEWSGVIGEWIEKGQAAWARRKASRRAPARTAVTPTPDTPGLLDAWREMFSVWIQSAMEWRARRRAPRVALSDFLGDITPRPGTARRSDTPPPPREMPPVAAPPLEEDFDASRPAPMPRRSSIPAAPKAPPAMPPPPLEALPTLRLAELPPEPEKEEEDIYDDGTEGFGAVRLWAKRAALVALALGALGIAVSWRSWWPGLQEHGAAVTTTLEAKLEKDREARAFETSLAQFPHLDAATVRLLSRDAPDLVHADPLEVFRRAYDAAERGLPTLAPEEAKELGQLHSRLLATFSAREREILSDYDGARRTRGTLPFQDRDALDLTARAANALPPESRTRLQKLNGKAIAAGLGSR